METGKASAVPAWMSSLVGSAGLLQIEKLIVETESKVQSEIIPMVVKSSSRLGTARLSALFVVVGVFGLIDLTFFSDKGLLYFLGLVALALATLFFVWRWDAALRLLIPDVDEWTAVHERAELEFYRMGLNQTEHRNGVLIFVSLFERKVMLLADEGISKKLDPQIWATTVDQLTASIRKREFSQGMTQAIKACGEILAEHFPGQTRSKDELRNFLVMKE